MKNSFSSLEIILTIIISSIICVYSFGFIKEIFFVNKDLQKTEIYRLDMLSTKAFLQKQTNIDKKLKLSNTTLYFNENILLEDVIEFNLNKKDSHIEILINLNNKIKQIWKFKI